MKSVLSKPVKKIRNTFYLAVIFFFISFFSLSALAVMPFLREQGQIIMGYTVAILFWIFLAFGLLFAAQAGLSISRSGVKKEHKLPGIISFSANAKHIIVYLVCGVGIALMLSDMIYDCISSRVMFPIISVTLFAFVIHCMVDGVNYKTFKKMKEGENDV